MGWNFGVQPIPRVAPRVAPRIGFSHQLGRESHSESCSENAPEFRELLREWPFTPRTFFFNIGVVPRFPIYARKLWADFSYPILGLKKMLTSLTRKATQKWPGKVTFESLFGLKSYFWSFFLGYFGGDPESHFLVTFGVTFNSSGFRGFWGFGQHFLNLGPQTAAKVRTPKRPLLRCGWLRGVVNTWAWHHGGGIRSGAGLWPSAGGRGGVVGCPLSGVIRANWLRREKTDKEKSHKGIWRSDAPEASQGQTRDVPGTPGTLGPDLCVNQY